MSTPEALAATIILMCIVFIIVKYSIKVLKTIIKECWR